MLRYLIKAMMLVNCDDLVPVLGRREAWDLLVRCNDCGKLCSIRSPRGQRSSVLAAC